MGLNPVDVAVAVVLALGALRGVWRGLVREAFGFLGLAVGLMAALTQTSALTVLVRQQVGLPESAAAALVFVTLFSGVYLVALMLGFLLDRLVVRRPLRIGNRAVGAVFGAAKAAFAVAFVLLFLQQFGIAPKIGTMADQSRIAPPLRRVAAEVLRNAGPLRERPRRS